MSSYVYTGKYSPKPKEAYNYEGIFVWDGDIGMSEEELDRIVAGELIDIWYSVGIRVEKSPGIFISTHVFSEIKTQIVEGKKKIVGVEGIISGPRVIVRVPPWVAKLHKKIDEAILGFLIGADSIPDSYPALVGDFISNISIYGDIRDAAKYLLAPYIQKLLKRYEFERDELMLVCSLVGIFTTLFPIGEITVDVLKSFLKGIQNTTTAKILRTLVKESKNVSQQKEIYKTAARIKKATDSIPDFVNKLDNLANINGEGYLGSFLKTHLDECVEWLEKMLKIQPTKNWKVGNLDSHYIKHVVQSNEFDFLYGRKLTK